MARGGKGDLADYEKVMKEKKLKPSIPSFTDLADDKVMNERQEISKYKKQKEYENHQKHINETVPVTDNITEQFLDRFSKNIKKEDSHTRQTWLIKK
ncbi:hypothetical protein ACT7C7_29930 [Bacillus cereus]